MIQVPTTKTVTKYKTKPAQSSSLPNGNYAATSKPEMHAGDEESSSSEASSHVEDLLAVAPAAMPVSRTMSLSNASPASAAPHETELTKSVKAIEDAAHAARQAELNSKEPIETKEALMKYVGGAVKTETSKPIAELFPEVTVLFADISGFTAWSSIREPSQVFMLLESIFGAFDEIANKRNVFKVETVGDCYVAVCGLPEPNEDHALVMARFARECMEKVNEVISELELTLGPDTAELAMRFGLHSGPVTAGVLRGDRARFQLFGDTVNTASRIETTGKRNRIHLSEQTASLIIAAGKKNWVIEREDEVEAKGKGLMKTYWLLTLRGDQGGNAQSESEAATNTAGREEHLPKSSFMERIKAIKEARASKQQRISRLIEWNSEMLIQLLKQVVARRESLSRRKTSAAALAAMAKNIGVGTMVVEEVAEIITLPEFDARLGKTQVTNMELPEDVIEQTRKYVAVVAGMYRNNPFHNFEHASHVTMSVSKLLSRIVAPQLDKSLTDEEADREALLHDHTYGITSDPLTQFAVVLSALIHDVDHRGIPNFLLIQEDAHLAAAYQNKSVAEQNSVDLAWQALMSSEFEALRACIFSDIAELRRFRQLLVNSVIATDIFDKELATARKARWDKAFSEEFQEGSRVAINRKATIVIEHLIQASDVAHTMQHWHVYTKWNERLFQEMYEAYQTGRWDKDPSAGWYEGEIGFLDNYVIPLAKKLKNCGVFGVASDEYLNYAQQNRREWEARGKEIVATFVERHAKKERAATQTAEEAVSKEAATPEAKKAEETEKSESKE